MDISRVLKKVKSAFMNLKQLILSLSHAVHLEDKKSINYEDKNLFQLQVTENIKSYG